MSMATTVITGKVRAIKGEGPGRTTIIMTKIGAVADTKGASLEEANESIKEEGVEVEHPRIGTKFAEENTTTPTETATIPAAIVTLQNSTTRRMLTSRT